jgi:Ras family protein
MLSVNNMKSNSNGFESNGGSRNNSRNQALLRKERNIVVLGNCEVGKTAICVRFAKDRFDETYEPTYENSWFKNYKWKGQEVDCVIKDTGGLSDQEIFRHDYGIGFHGYVLVYSIANKHSLDTLKGIHEKLLDLTVNSNIPRVLVGNKVDLAEHNMRQVTYAEGRALAEEWGCAFVEASAKWNKSVDTVFDRLLEEVERSSTEPEPPGFISPSRWIESCCGAGTSMLQSMAAAFIYCTGLTGMAGIVCGVILLANGVSDQFQGLLLVGLAMGFGFLMTLVSLFGAFGVRNGTPELVKVYTLSMVLLMLMETAVGVVLFRKGTLEAYQPSALFVGCFVLVLELCALAAVCLYQPAIAPQGGEQLESMVAHGYGID